MGKLWDKGYDLDALVEEFTVGRDYELDGRLVPADCAASLAHATMLSKIGILTSGELVSLRQELAALVEDHAAGRFAITQKDEDCHTAIENRLTERLGEAGKKIHTGRSRNDQVVTALRLFAKGFLFEGGRRLAGLIESLRSFAAANAELPMPGRTHLQIAMPSSVGLWAGAYAEELLDDLRYLWGAYTLCDQSPLGSAASYGVPLPLDRELEADLLGFSRVQNNVLYANNSRGKFESIILDAVDQIGLTLSKLAQDLILFSLPELGYFTLPDKLCSGSSIMPQKKNPDALELLRAKSATLSACAVQVKSIIRSLPSGYNRDFQETKEPFLRGCGIVLLCIRVAEVTVSSLTVNPDRLAKGFTPEIYATDAALELVAKGWSFRDAYREVGTHLDRLAARDPKSVIRGRTSTGTTGNLGLDRLHEEATLLSEAIDAERLRVAEKIESLVGIPVALYVP